MKTYLSLSLMNLSVSQVYKKLGQTHLALMNFSWAMDLDPKGANNQIKEAIDKRYLPEDEGETGTSDRQVPTQEVKAAHLKFPCLFTCLIRVSSAADST